MGYTHYWTPKPATNENWLKFINKVKELHKALPQDVKIAGGDGHGEPIFSMSIVKFNGNAKDDGDYETFVLYPNGNKWDFCKTQYRPYDLFVGSVLILAQKMLGYSVNSDGDKDDWSHIYEFLKSQKITGKLPQHK